MKKVLVIVGMVVLLMGGCTIGCSVLIKKGMPGIFNAVKENIMGNLTDENGNPVTPQKSLSEQDKQKNFQLMRAVADGDIQTVRKLLQEGVDPNIMETEKGYTPLLIAADRNNTEMAALLLSAGADANAQLNKSEYNVSALLMACNKGNSELVNMLLTMGASLYTTDSKGFTALHYAAASGNQKIAQRLLQEGMDVDITSSMYTTPLMLAANEGQLEMVRFLLRVGANPQARNKDGDTVLFFAQESTSPNKQQIIKLLQRTLASKQS